MDCDGSLDPADLPRVADPVARRRRRPGARRARRRPRRLAAHARLANRVLVVELAPPRRTAPARPRPDARRPARAAARPRHRRPPLRLAAGDGRARRPRRLADRARSTSPTASAPAARRSPAPCAARCAPCATWRRCSRERRPAVTLAVIAKAPVAGRVKTRLCPPCTPEEAAALAEAALRDTLAAMAAAAPRAAWRRRVVVLDGAPGAWLGDERTSRPAWRRPRRAPRQRLRRPRRRRR